MYNTISLEAFYRAALFSWNKWKVNVDNYVYILISNQLFCYVS